MDVLSKHFYAVVVKSLLSLDSLKTLKRYTNSFKKQISGSILLFLSILMNNKSYKIITKSLVAGLFKCSAKEVFLKILRNSQENTRVRVLFLIKLQDEKLFLNSQKRTCAGASLLIKLQTKKFTKFTKKHLYQCLTFTEAAGWKHNYNIKLLIDLHFLLHRL